MKVDVNLYIFQRAVWCFSMSFTRNESNRFSPISCNFPRHGFSIIFTVRGMSFVLWNGIYIESESYCLHTWNLLQQWAFLAGLFIIVPLRVHWGLWLQVYCWPWSLRGAFQHYESQSPRRKFPVSFNLIFPYPVTIISSNKVLPSCSKGKSRAQDVLRIVLGFSGTL